MTEKCDKCGTRISRKVADFSWARFGKPLCIPCQKSQRTGEAKTKGEEELADFINKQI